MELFFSPFFDASNETMYKFPQGSLDTQVTLGPQIPKTRASMAMVAWYLHKEAKYLHKYIWIGKICSYFIWMQRYMDMHFFFLVDAMSTRIGPGI